MTERSPALLGVGIALVDTPRFERSLERFGERLLERVFTAGEIAYAARRKTGHHNLAARFAAKCAGRQVLRRMDPRPLGLAELEVMRRRSGEPTLKLGGAAAQRFPSQSYRLSLSLTHDAEFALASVWLERR